MAPHSSTLAWKIPWIEEPGRLQSVGLLESDTTEWLQFHFSLSCIGEGNGNPLQCSCLENPRDGGAWWTAIHGVAQNRTRLKRLSSSSSSSNLKDLYFSVLDCHIDFYQRWCYWGECIYMNPWKECLYMGESSPGPITHIYILRHSAFFIVQTSHSYMITGKIIALIRQTYVSKVMSLLFNMPSRLVITFLARSKCLLISWLQSPSAVILETLKIKSVTVSIVSLSTCHEVMGTDAMILVF